MIPAASSTSALPDFEDIERFPCFATFPPAAATTKAEAVEILNRALTINPSNQKTFWKMTRLTFYVWERFAEYKKGNLGRKTDTIRKVVNLPEYKRMHNTFPVGKFDAEKEFKNLNKLLDFSCSKISGGGFAKVMLT